MKRKDEVNVKVVPEEETQGALEGLTNPEVHNLNQQTTLTSFDGADGVSQLIEGVASGTSPTIPSQQYKDAVRKALEREYLQFLYAQSMGAWKSWAYVGHVKKQLSLTDEQARAAQKEVFEEFRENANPSEWDIFVNGTPEQWKALQDAIAREMYGDDQNEATVESSINSESAEGTIERLSQDDPKIELDGSLDTRIANLPPDARKAYDAYMRSYMEAERRRNIGSEN